jgi:hypothetical protein
LTQFPRRTRTPSGRASCRRGVPHRPRRTTRRCTPRDSRCRSGSTRPHGRSRCASGWAVASGAALPSRLTQPARAASGWPGARTSDSPPENRRSGRRDGRAGVDRLRRQRGAIDRSASATAWNASGSREAGVAGGRAIEPVVTVSVQIAARKASDAARRAVRRPRRDGSAEARQFLGACVQRRLQVPLMCHRSVPAIAPPVIGRAWDPGRGTRTGYDLWRHRGERECPLEDRARAVEGRLGRPASPPEYTGTGAKSANARRWTRSGSCPATRRPGRRPCRRRSAPAG